MSNLPWFKFFSSDWRADPRLRLCSMAAQGLWISILCLMHESPERGYLLVNSGDNPEDKLGRLIGLEQAEAAQLLAELERNGVFSRDQRGVIFSRRMVRDAQITFKRRDAGRRGGNPALLKQADKPVLKQVDMLRCQMPEARVPPPTPPPGETQAPTTRGYPVRKPRLPRQARVPGNSPLMEQVGGWFHRRPGTLWTQEEAQLLDAAVGDAPGAEDLELMERYYTAQIPATTDFRRRDLPTLLRNWSSELDRARGWQTQQRQTQEGNVV